MKLSLAWVKRRVGELPGEPEFPRKRNAQDGFAVVMVLLIMIIMALLGLSLLTVAAYQFNDADRAKPSNRAFDLADSGLSYGKAYLAREEGPIPYPSSEPPITVAPGSTFDLTIVVDTSGAYRYKIVSTGTYQASERGVARHYSRTLEEVVEFRGIQGHFEAFNYCMYSRDNDVTLNTGWLALNSTKIQVDGKIYAGRDVNLTDTKTFAAGYLQVNGDVVAGGNANLEPRGNANLSSRTGVIANGSDSVNGNLTAGGNVSISAETGAGAGSSWNVSGSVNAGGNVSLTANAIVLAAASVAVAQNSGTNLNAGGSVTIDASSGIVAGATVDVGGGSQASNVNANGAVSLRSYNGLLWGSLVRVYGSVNTKAVANLTADCAVAAWPLTYVGGNVRCNGNSALTATGIGTQTVDIDGEWRYGGTPSETRTYVNWWPLYVGWLGTISYGSKVPSSPNVGDAPVQAVPDVTMPEPDWDWYRTMAIAQGHYYTGNGNPFDSTPQVITNVTIDGDPSSMWVLYCTDDLQIQNVIYNVQKRGVIVCEGDVSVTHSVQWQPNTEYQVIGRGNITHASYMTLNPNANDTVFLYTNGTHDHDQNPATQNGNVIYDLGWFRDIQGQITCTGAISAPVSGFARDARITYKAPSVPVEAWPLPFKVHSFREL